MKSDAIKTFNQNEFLSKFMGPAPKLRKMIKDDQGRFFMVPVQDMIKISQVPVPPTRATTHTLIYLTEGVASMTIGFQKVKIKKNECLIVAAGQVFSYDKHEVNKGFISNFDDDFLISRISGKELLKEFDFLNIWGNPVIKPKGNTVNYIRQTLQRVLDEYQQNGLTNVALIKSYFIAALCELNTAYQPLSKSGSQVALTLVNRFKEAIHKHIKEKHHVTDYASLLHVSPNHLNKTVKSVTGKPASAWISETLITEAKVMLVHTDHSISEIATALGVYDQSYFSRLFKKYEKVTPLEYRKMIDLS